LQVPLPDTEGLVTVALNFRRVQEVYQTGSKKTAFHPWFFSRIRSSGLTISTFGLQAPTAKDNPAVKSRTLKDAKISVLRIIFVS
jgi:hypothetical protein